MTRPGAPLRFLVLAVGGWALARTAFIAPDWWVEEGTAAAPSAVAAAQAAPVATVAAVPRPGPAQATPNDRRVTIAWAVLPAPRSSGTARPPAMPPALAVASVPAFNDQVPRTPATRAPTPLPFAPPRPLAQNPSRWSGSAWLLVRGEERTALAPQGTLGGSQAGLRLSYRLNGDAARPLALTARLYAPLRDRRAAEAAIGIDWQPVAALPVHLVAERRQALLGRGRSAFALSAYGGVSAEPVRGLRVEAWGQAGVVGARSRDLFADGAARAAIQAGRVEIGAGVWGGAQPGASRLDAGPLVAMRLPGLGEHVRLSAEWRFRIAGDARPDSGPALTLGSDF